MISTMSAYEITNTSFLQGQELHLLKTHVSTYLGSLRTKSVVVDGSTVRYLEGGEGDPVVFLHGVASPKTHYRSLMKSVSSGCRVIAPDVPGFSASSRLNNGRHNLRNLSHWLKQFMAALELERITLVGVSLGSTLSIYHAYHYPEQIDKLCLFSVPEARSLNGCSVMSIMVDVFERLEGTQDIDELMEMCFYYPPAMHSIIKNKMFKDLKVNQQHFCELLKDVSEGQLQIKAKLPHIKAPTLLISGESDPICPIAFARSLDEQIPNSTIHILSHSKHLTFLEKHGEVVALLNDFLRHGV